MIDVVGIGKAKEQYPQFDDSTFMSLSEYLMAAEKAIKYFMPMLRPEMTKHASRDEDLIAGVANAMMLADWKWKADGGRTRRSYRNHHACYYLRSYIGRQAKNKLPFHYSIDNDEGFVFRDDKAIDPSSSFVKSEKEERWDDLQEALIEDILSQREKMCITEYYVNDRTMKDIGTSLGITKQRVKQNLDDAERKLKEYLSGV